MLDVAEDAEAEGEKKRRAPVLPFGNAAMIRMGRGWRWWPVGEVIRSWDEMIESR